MAGAKLTGSLTKRMTKGQRGVKAAVKSTGDDIAKGASARAPRDTNHLADESINAEEIDDFRSVVTVQTADATHHEYGHFVELGTSNQPAQPYFIPAVEAAREPFRRKIAKAYKP